MNTARQPLLFYQYLGSHSLLIGLLPFYLPVYLWGTGFDLAHISLLIGISGLTFTVALSWWQRLSRRLSLKRLLCYTFAFEVLLVASTFFTHNTLLAVVLIGIANGLYNGFFWTTQRTLFLQLLGNNDTGKRYGNFQIFVTVFLKIGILIGGWLLDAGGLPWLLALSAVIGALCSVWFQQKATEEPLQQEANLSFKSALLFRDKRGSRPVFMADGFFLFLESHYWTLSLFMLASENYAKLGVLVVVLAVLFALLFYLIKNTIDSFAVEVVYRAAVILYALSWLGRSVISDEFSTSVLMLTLLLITFCTTFFRLAFNKRFFDISQQTGGVHYLLVKSYQSQFILGLGFVGTALLLWLANSTGLTALQPVYVVAAAGSFVYLIYKKKLPSAAE